MDGADVVVIAGHDRFDYDELRFAVQAILGGAQALCTSRDATFPMPDGPWPGTGAIVAAVEAATGVEAVTVGKPSPDIFRTALDRLGPGRALVVGDRADADLAGALAADLDGALVGGERSDDAVACATTLADLVLA
jgi:ribonucleotide monophosphatase NagD (HAD superfamily)